MTHNQTFTASLPTAADRKENKMDRRKLGLIVGTAVLAAVVTVAVRAAALRADSQPAAVEPAAAAAEPLVHKDLNELTIYRASEWGLNVPQPAPVDLNNLKIYRASEWGLNIPLPAPVDLNDLKIYRASEWGHPEDTLTPERLYHHLMIVK